MKNRILLLMGTLLLMSVSCGPTKIQSRYASKNNAIDLALVADVKGAKSTEDSSPVRLVRPGKISVESTLTRRDGTALTSESLKTESQYLRLYVTDYIPQNSKDIEEKKVWWWQNWSSSLTFELPNSVANKKLRLFITLVKVSPESNTETFLQTIPLDLFVDGSFAGVTWLSRPQYIPAAQNARIPLQVEIGLQGAPIEGSPKVESTIDGSTWSEIAIENWKPIADKPNTFEFSVQYPFIGEKPFRIRLKMKDTIGNEAVSDFSPNLIGRSDFEFRAATDSERQACKDGANASASQLVLMAPTSVLCRARGVNGEITASRKLTILIDNRGSVPFKLAAEATGLSGDMEYALNGGGTDARAQNIVHSKILSTDLLKAPIEYNWDIDITRISVSKVINARLDKNIAGKYSSSGTSAQGNTCYSGAGYPAAVFQNPAANVMLQDSVFPCYE
jgi:hypothetical protein